MKKIKNGKQMSPEAAAYHALPNGYQPNHEQARTAISMVRSGEFFGTACKVAGFSTQKMGDFICRDSKLKKEFEAARTTGTGRIAKLARLALIRGLKKCHPFWFKVACWKYPIDLPDPDFEAKRALMELEGVTTAQVDELVSGILADLQAAASTPAAREAFAKCSVLQDTLARIRERRNQLQGGWQKRDTIRQAELEKVNANGDS